MGNHITNKDDWQYKLSKILVKNQSINSFVFYAQTKLGRVDKRDIFWEQL